MPLELGDDLEAEHYTAIPEQRSPKQRSPKQGPWPGRGLPAGTGAGLAMWSSSVASAPEASGQIVSYGTSRSRRTFATAGLGGQPHLDAEMPGTALRADQHG